MDRLEAMSLLLRVVETGSFSAAGRALNIPVPTISRKISDLEALLGARLLTRTTRKLSLTDAGLRYVAAARGILERVEDAEREAAGEFSTPKGDLTLSAPILFGRLHVLPVVTDFLAAYPEINIRLLLSDRNVHLIDDHVDMAVRIGALPDSGMVATRIGAMRKVTVASPDLIKIHGIPTIPDELARYPTVVFDGPLPQFDGAIPGQSLAGPDVTQQTPRLSVTTTQAVADAAIRGTGIARLLHYQVADAVDAGQLQIVLETFEPAPLPIHLIHASRGQMPLKLRSFLDYAAPRLRRALSRFSKN
ncbi:LysR family transcriptional regulator [Rhodospirillaceae bacterium KN72]|uniref:LysR family transcriptional regulator n=1 Tax=Pacificispira spongiicola TaxID=2729598 RepID=A0A7Y0E227_9PROT|nr:LysR family transcriptional regulator [Pacificispira spongiicola]NMM45795.1 LysR family transcriptional regulator [Pacificispira spongiicola]